MTKLANAPSLCVVVLDSGPLGMVTNPKVSQANLDCAAWLADLITRDVTVVVPEIADFEVRRELMRAGRLKGVERLDELAQRTSYLPIDTGVMRDAARLWAEARQGGRPTAAPDALDADVILAAQALSLGSSGVVVATTNVGHLSRFVSADHWSNIR